jgi:hypothetical protein
MEITPILTPKKENFNLLFFGKKGYGKTSFVRGLIRDLKRLLIMDTLGYEYTEVDGIVLSSYDELVEQLLALSNIDTDSFRFILRNVYESGKLFTLWWNMKNVTLLVEEMDKYCNRSSVDPSISEHMSRGRHNENNLISVSRFPQEIATTLRQGCDCMISFQQDESNIKKILADTNAELAEKLPELKKSKDGKTIEGENYLILKGKEYLETFLEQNKKETTNE